MSEKHLNRLPQPTSQARDDSAVETMAELEKALERADAPPTESNTTVVDGELLKAFNNLKRRAAGESP
jgi:hypothetical protein